MKTWSDESVMQIRLASKAIGSSPYRYRPGSLPVGRARRNPILIAGAQRHTLTESQTDSEWIEKLSVPFNVLSRPTDLSIGL